MEDLERIHRMEVLEKLCEKLSEKNAKWMEDWMENHPIDRDITKSYLHTIKGEKEAAEEVDRKIMAPFLQKRDAAQKKLVAAQEELKNLKAESDMLTSFSPVRPSSAMIKGLKDDLEKLYRNSEEVEEMQGLVVEKEARLEAIEEKNRKLCKENEVMRGMLSGLEKMEGVERNSVEAEPPNAIDIDRMIRDYRAFSRDIEAAREARIAWENKLKDVELTLLAHELVETTARIEEKRELIKSKKILNSCWEMHNDLLEAQIEELISDTEEHQRRCEENDGGYPAGI